MTQNKRALALIIGLFLGLALLIIYIFTELYNDNPYKDNLMETYSFKEEYEELNNDKNYLNIKIEDNLIQYKNEFDIIDYMEKKESFIVYFGFKECNWCRSTLGSFVKTANKSNIKNIYYVNIANIRDTYELNDKNELIKTVEGTEGYYKLLKVFNSILDDYESLVYTDNKGKVSYANINEKRIYAPAYIIVKNGKPITKISGISKLQKNELDNLNDEIKKDQQKIFEDFFKNYSNNQNTCSATDTKC